MEIQVVSTFLHGETRYEEGEPYDVSDEEGRYFVNNGWATSDEYSVPNLGNQDEVKEIQPVDLEVHDSTISNTGEVK